MAVYGVDLSTGEQAWKADRAYGPSATPAAISSGGADSVLFTQGSDTEDSSIAAVDAASGKPVWDQDVALKAVSRTGVVVDGGTAFVADDRGNVYAVDAARGRLLWTVQVSGRPLGPLTVSGADVLVTLAGEDRGLPVVEALDAKTGDRRWQVAPDVFGSGATSGVAHNGAFFVGLPDRAVHSFDLSDGAARWTSQAFFSLPAPFGAGAAYGDDVIFVFFADPSGDVRRLDGATGHTVWDFPLNEPVLRSSPVLSGGAVVLGMRDGSLAAIDAASGEQIFRSPPQGGLLGGIAVTPDLLVAVRGGLAGGLVAFEHDEGAAITRVPSPSTLDPVDLVGRFVAAVAVIMVVLVAPLWYLGRRRSPALADSNDSPSDPIEDAAFGNEADDDPDDGRSGS